MRYMGYWYVNAGDYKSGHIPPQERSWEDMRKYGFISAGGAPVYSKPLSKLLEGDRIYAYYKAKGYVGFGIVTARSVMAKDFRTSDGRALSQVDLVFPRMLDRNDNPIRTEYIVAVDWKKTVPATSAKTYRGIFYYRNMVCKLQGERQPETLEFLAKELGS